MSTTLLLSLPNEHQLRLSKYKTAQELWAAILKTFGGNEATKKTKKNLLKQQYGNFKAEGTETLEQTFNRLQVIVSQLEFMDIEIEHDDLNQKFLTSLAPEWLMHAIVWRNMSDLDTISLDDLYNHLKDINQIYEDDMEEMDIKWNMALLSIRADRFWKKTRNKITIQGLPGVKTGEGETTTYKGLSKNMMFHYKAGLSQVEGRLAEFKNQEIKFCEKIKGLELQVEFKTNRIKSLTNELKLLKKEKGKLDTKLTGFQTASKNLDNLLESQRSDKNKEGLGYSAIPPLSAQFYSPPTKDMSWTGLPEFVDDTITDYSRPSPTVESKSDDLQNRNPFVTETKPLTSTILSKPHIKFVKATDRTTKTKTAKPIVKYAELYRKPTKRVDHGSLWAKNNNPYKSKTPRIVFYKTGRPPIKTNRPYMNAAQPKRTSFYKPTHSYNKRPFQRTSAVRSQFRGPRVATVNRKFPTVNRKLPTINRKFPTGNTKFSTADMECIVLGRNFKLIDNTNVLLRTPRQHNMYSIDLNNIVQHNDLTCLVAKASADKCMLWHRRLGKQHKASCKTKLVNSVTKPLYTLHMDLSGPTSTFFLKTRDETSGIFRNFITEIENLKELKVKIIRCDNKGEFRNKEMNDFCSRKGIKREFSNARTPQQNGVAERRNRTLIEAARTMLADAKLLVTFWAEAVNTACYIQNKVLVNKSQNKTPYELFNGKTPAIGFLKPFGCHVMILNTLDNLRKFKAKGDEGYFIGYKGCNKSRVETSIPTVSSPVPTACFEDSQEPTTTTKIISKRVTSQDETPSLDTILTLANRFDDILGVTTSTVDSHGEEADEEGIDYDEVFAPVVRIEAIRLFLAYASFMGFTVYQMDVKSDFLYGTIDEEVYVMQPPRFQDPEFPARVNKVKKSNVWITSGSSSLLCREFEALIHEKFQMSAMVKRIFRYLKGHPKLGLWYPKESPFDLVAYSDSNYGGATQDRKPTTKGCQFLGRRLIFWQCKKKKIMATSITEAEYAATASGCGQVLQETACAYIASQSGGSQIEFEDINQINEDDMEEMDIKWNLALLSMRADKFWKKTGKKISIQGSDVVGFNKSKVECFNCHKMGHFARECRASRNQERGRRDTYRQGSKAEEQTPKALMAIEGVGWDWSYMENDEEDHALIAEAPTEFALMADTSTENKVKCSQWQYKFPLQVKVVATARRLEMPLPEVGTAIEEKKKKLPVKDRWQLH
nr:hypothetical protein [Tanacetum cinerariifolium]